MTVVPTLGTHVTGITRDASVTALESRFANASEPSVIIRANRVDRIAKISSFTLIEIHACIPS